MSSKYNSLGLINLLINEDMHNQIKDYITKHDIKIKKPLSPVDTCLSIPAPGNDDNLIETIVFYLIIRGELKESSSLNRETRAKIQNYNEEISQQGYVEYLKYDYGEITTETVAQFDPESDDEIHSIYPDLTSVITPPTSIDIGNLSLKEFSTKYGESIAYQYIFNCLQPFMPGSIAKEFNTKIKDILPSVVESALPLIDQLGVEGRMKMSCKISYLLGQMSIAEAVANKKSVKLAEKNLTSLMKSIDHLNKRLSSIQDTPKIDPAGSILNAVVDMKTSFDTLNLSVTNFITKSHHPSGSAPTSSNPSVATIQRTGEEPGSSLLWDETV